MKILAAFLCTTLVLVAARAHSADRDVAALLRDNDLQSLQISLNDLQHRFESGAVTEFEMRNAYRPFYNLDAPASATLQKWAAASPVSYPARLAYGIYLKKRGMAARGEDYVSRIPPDKLAEAERYFAQSEQELRQSLRLTAKPYLSIFHLLDIAMTEGDAMVAQSLLKDANRILPTNILARGRYITTLMPRWGGSYEQADAFIARTRTEGASPSILTGLQAIEEDDKGHSLEENGDHRNAYAAFERALVLGKSVGSTFQADFLVTSRYYLCSGERKSPNCT